jgi:hypothetical protein
MTTTRLSPFDEFMLYFEALKDAAKGHQWNDLKLGRILEFMKTVKFLVQRAPE